MLSCALQHQYSFLLSLTVRLLLTKSMLVTPDSEPHFKVSATTTRYDENVGVSDSHDPCIQLRGVCVFESLSHTGALVVGGAFLVLAAMHVALPPFSALCVQAAMKVTSYTEGSAFQAHSMRFKNRI